MTNHQLSLKKPKEQIQQLTDQMSILLPTILSRHSFSLEAPDDMKRQQHSLHAIIGGKNKTYLNTTDMVISSADEFVSLWLQGLMKHIETVDNGKETTRAAYQFLQLVQQDNELFQYTTLFLKRTYLRNCGALSRKRPTKEEAELWFGQNHASYGIFITPRFQNGKWENDVSEIRHFKQDYWTIGHILKTGFVIPNKPDVVTFPSVEQYLSYFKNSIVRLSGSPYEMGIAERYCDFVRHHNNPDRVPLLIPELRYGGLCVQHKYRLDFTIINPYTLQKQGFEFSPWSTHGYLSKTKGKSQKEINEEAKANFEEEMEKHKDYYRTHHIFTLIYTDKDLQNLDNVFDEMLYYLNPKRENKQLLDATVNQVMHFTI